LNIAINCRHLLKGKLEGFGNYTYEITKRICENHKEHTFYLIFDREFDVSFVFAKNCIPIKIGPPTRHPILTLFWIRHQLHKALKRYKIDLFWSPDGICDLNAEIPQIITIHDLNFEYHPEDSPKWVSWYYRRYYPQYARKANQIITVSDYSKNDICNCYNIDQKKISVVYNGVSNEFGQISNEEKAKYQTSYTKGKRYFIFVGSIHPRKNVNRLLEAYELFYKKNPEYQLLIVGSNMWRKQSLKVPEAIEQSVFFTGHVQMEILTKLMASAYALVYPPYFEGFGIPLVEAMKCGVPILSSDRTCLPEVAGNAALYFDPFDVVQMSRSMEEITTKPSKREELIEIGLKMARNYNWDQAASKTWKILQEFL
jgi:glycosyltransferase involved in cell wall biosynthesis